MVGERPGQIQSPTGPRSVYEYLATLGPLIGTDVAPFLIDCLSCERGCNGGPGTLSSGKRLDEVERPVERRASEARSSWRRMGAFLGVAALRHAIKRRWKPGLYARSYVDRSGDVGLRTPTKAELARVYASMGMTREADFYN